MSDSFLGVQSKLTAKEVSKYRELLESIAGDSQSSYDKAVLALSSGSLGVSFAFVTNFIKEEKIESSYLLLTSWVFWIFSVTAVLYSYYFSNKALNVAINQRDEQIDKQGDVEIYTIEVANLGGLSNKATNVLNALSGASFVIGVLVMFYFVNLNMR